MQFPAYFLNTCSILRQYSTNRGEKSSLLQVLAKIQAGKRRTRPAHSPAIGRVSGLGSLFYWSLQRNAVCRRHRLCDEQRLARLRPAPRAKGRNLMPRPLAFDTSRRQLRGALATKQPSGREGRLAAVEARIMQYNSICYAVFTAWVASSQALLAIDGAMCQRPGALA